MGAIAFVFPGQGAQFPGMGRDLYEAFPEARAAMDAVEAARPGTLKQCFEGPQELLRETRNTQPCMYAVETAAAAALAGAGVRPSMAAGFSLGEIAALACAGAVSLEEGMRLVSRRGEIMQRAAEQRDTAMAAVVKLTNAQVEELCARFSEVYPVNYNSPGQVAVSGAAEEMPAFAAAVKAAGGRAIPLKVRGGFHSPFMDGASREFGEVLAKTEFAAPAIDLYSNCTGARYEGGMPELLERQIRCPVRWEAIVRGMIASGADTMIECGPGDTLRGLIKRIDPSVRLYGAGTPEEIETIRAEVLSC